MVVLSPQHESEHSVRDMNSEDKNKRKISLKLDGMSS